MHLVRYVTDTQPEPRVGVAADDAVYTLPYATLAEAWQVPLTTLRSACDAARTPVGGKVRLLPPVDGRTEVWAAGVTYKRSREARMQESEQASVYDRVYTAERPELFFKSAAWRVRTDGDLIGIRADSGLDVPEPELAVVANAAGEVVGYTVCNDVSSRRIEGENPLYLPQAKVYAGSCALAPGIRPVWEVENALDLSITCQIVREHREVWSGRASTADMARDPLDLLSWLLRQDHHPDGVVLSTGTGIVPAMDVTLHAGDTVDIEIAHVGHLSNQVATGLEPFRPRSAEVVTSTPAGALA